MNPLEYLRGEIIEEFDDGYITGGERDRRLRLIDNFSERVTKPTSAEGRSAGSQGPVVESDPDSVVFVSEDDPAIETEEYSLRQDEATTVYLALSRTAGKKPGILVIHEKLGLTRYIKDVARRLAKLDYVALAPDLLWRQGGTASFGDTAAVIAAVAALTTNDMLSDLRASVSALATMGGVVAERIGVIGFCFGGGLAWRLATKEPRLAAAVPFYGPNPPIEDVPSINAPVLAVYAGLDDRINSGIDEIERAMRENFKAFEKAIFPNARHAFHNDTMPERYNAEAARHAWKTATVWLSQHLKET